MKAVFDPLWRAGLRVAFRLQLSWWWLRRPVIRGASVAVWHEGRVLVIRNSYRRSESFPAGGIKRGEEPREAARRELAEEVGLRVSPDALDYCGEFVHTQLAEDHVHVFELRCDTPPAVKVDGREVISAGFLTPGEALARQLMPSVRAYLESRAAATASSNDTPSRSPRR